MKWIRKEAYRIVDLIRRTDAEGVFEELNETQWWPKEKLERLQFDRLKALLIHCKRNVPYYKDLFDSVGFNPDEPFNIEDFKRIPVCTKDTMRQNFERLKAVNIQDYKPRVKTTGGSTGQPINYLNDFKSHSYLAANNLRVWSVGSDYTIGDKFITIAHGSLMPKNNTWKNRFYFLFQNSILITSYHLNEERLNEAINIINSSSAKFIYGYSSSILMIAKFAEAKNIKITSKLQAIFTTSDMLYKNQRELIEKVFGVIVYDSYGCPESGIVSFECNEHNGYHLNQESSYVEILSQDIEGLGKIVSTPLLNYAMPLIRYETGDVGKYSHEQCKCGRWLPKITQLGGRIRDFVILEDGRYIHGAFFNHLKPFYNNDWIGEYQIIQKAYDHLLIKITPRRMPTEKDKEIIINELRKGLLSTMKIDFDLNGVQYTSGGKFRLIISEVQTRWEK